MSYNVDLRNCCGPGAPVIAEEQTKPDNRLGRSLITVGVLILVGCLCGGRVFGGYGNYPGYGGYSIYGYTPIKPKPYKYIDDYYGFDEPDY